MAGEFFITGEIQLRPPRNMGNIINNMQNQLNGLTATVSLQTTAQTNTNIKNLQKNLKALRAQTVDTSKFVEELGKKAGQAIQVFLGYTLVTKVFFGLVGAISSGVHEAIKFNRELVKISQVTDQSVGRLKGLSKEITRVATTFGVSSQKLLESSLILAQAGFAANDVTVALETLAKTDVAPTFENIIKTTEGSIAILRQFKLETKDLESALGAVNQVSAKFAVESGDLIAAVRRAGGAFAASGGSLNELIALFTSVRATTRESAESIATGFRTIFTRLQRQKTIDFLDKLGIRGLRDEITNEFVGPFEAIRILNKELSSISPKSSIFAQVIEELGGFRQVSKVIPLIQEFETAQKALSEATRGQNSLNEDAVASQQALLIQIVKTKEEFQDLIRTIVESSTFQSVSKTILNLATSFLQLAKSLEPLIPLLTAFAAVGLGKRIGTLALGAKQTLLGTNSRFPFFNQGGQVQKFSSGGLVAGSGSGDTVPAMLSPGEYVIRKKAVEALGVNRLQGLNRKASGGSVRRFMSGRVVTPTGELSDEDERALIAALVSQDKTTVRKYFGANARLDSAKNALINTGRYTENKTLGKYGVSAVSQEVAAANIANIQKQEQKAAIRATQKDITVGTEQNPIVGGFFLRPPTGGADKVQNGALTKEVYKKVFGQFVGLSPSDINHVFIPVDINNIDPNQVDAFENIANKNIRNAIKRSALTLTDKKGVGQVENEVLNSIGIDDVTGKIYEGTIAQITKQFATNGSNDIFDFFISNQVGATKEQEAKFKKLFGALNPSVLYADAKVSIGTSNRNIGGIRDKAFKYAAGVDNKYFKQNTSIRRALGGNTYGEDTVPALLTPGEFVIRKEAAKKIGLGNLHNLNKADKFNKGGVVGGYASGGRVAGQVNGVGLLAFGTVLFTLQNQLEGLGEGFKNIIQALAGFAFTLTAFQEIGRNSIPLAKTIEKVNIALEREAKIRDVVAARDKRVLALRKQADLASQGKANPLTPQEQAFLANNPASRNRLNARANTARAQANNLRAKQVRIERFGRFAAVGSALGSTLSSFATDAGTKRIQNGDASGINFRRAGGALSGGGQGVAIGAIFGPFGAAIGGVVGGLYGLLSASKQAAKELQTIKIEKSFQKIESTLAKFESNIFSASEDFPKLQSIIKNINNDFNNSPSDISSELGNQIKNNFVPIIQKQVSELAKSSSSLSDFESKTKDIIPFLAVFGNVPISELDKQFKDLINTASQQNAINQKYLSISKELSNQLISINNIVSGFQTLDTSYVLLRNSFETLSSIIENDAKISILDLSDVIKNASNISSDTFGILAKTISNQFTSLGGATSKTVSDVTDLAIVSQRLQSELPKILLGLRIPLSPGERGTDPAEDVYDEIINVFGDLPDAVSNILKTNIKAALGEDINPSEILDLLAKDPIEAAKKFSAGLGDFVNVLQPINDAARDFLNQYVNSLQLRVSIEKRITDRLSSILDLRESAEKTLANATGRSIDNNLLQRIDRQRQLNILGPGNAGLANNPAAIGNAIQTAQANIQRLQEDQIGKDIRVRAAANAQIVKEQQQVARLNSALQFLTDASSRSAVAQDKLAKLQAQRQSFRELATSYAFGTREEKSRVDTAIVQLVRGIQAGFNVNVIPEKIRGDVLSLLKNLAPGVKSGFLGGLTPEEAIDKFNRSSLKGAPGFAAPTTGPEAGLINEIKAAFKTAEEALKALNKIDETSIKSLESIIVRQNNDFLTRLESILLSNSKSILERELGTLKNKSITSSEKSSALDKLLSIGRNQSGINKLESSLSDVQSLKTILEQRKSIASSDTAKLFKNRVEEFNFGLKGFDKGEILGLLQTREFQTSAEKTFGSNAPNITQQLIERINASGDIGGPEFDKLVSFLYEQQKTTSKGLSVQDAELTKILKSNGYSDKNIEFLVQNLDYIKKQFSILGEDSKSIDTFRNSLNDTTNQILELEVRLTALNARLGDVKPKSPVARASGGFIPGYGNSDSVHAMLTPGEFVIRKSAATRLGPAFLNKINKTGAKKFASGGFVTSNGTNNTILSTQVINGINSFNQSVITFNNNAQRLAIALDNFPREISIQARHTVEIIHNGAEVFNTLTPLFKEMVVKESTSAINKMLKDKFPEVGQI